jgi:hypothetical protein
MVLGKAGTACTNLPQKALMRDHENLVLRALESMTRRYPHFQRRALFVQLKFN